MTGLPSYATDPKMTGQPSPVEKPPYKPTGRDGFTAYMDKIAGGAKWKDGVMIDGPFKGMDRNGLMAKAREQYAALPDADKRVWQDQSTGNDLEVGGRPAVVAKTGSGPGGGLRTGSLSTSSGIDWLKANRTSGPELAQQEANVGKTGDRFKSPVEKPVMQPKTVAINAGTPGGYDPEAPEVDSPPIGSSMPAATPAAKPVTAAPGIAATPIKPVTAAPVSPSLVEKPKMNLDGGAILDAADPNEALRRKNIAARKPFIPSSSDMKDVNNEFLRNKNPGIKPNLIKGYQP